VSLKGKTPAELYLGYAQHKCKSFDIVTCNTIVNSSSRRAGLLAGCVTVWIGSRTAGYVPQSLKLEKQKQKGSLKRFRISISGTREKEAGNPWQSDLRVDWKISLRCMGKLNYHFIVNMLKHIRAMFPFTFSLPSSSAPSTILCKINVIDASLLN
jgi:hypothetical protein